jgi:hypothetical protein
MQFAVYDPERTNSIFCPEDIYHFVKLCLSEVLKRYEQNETECVKNSCFYRLVKSMQEHINLNPCYFIRYKCQLYIVGFFS